MKVKVPSDLSNLKTDGDDFIPTLSQLLNQIIQVLNGRVEFGVNCLVSFVTVTFSAANAQQAISHMLNKIPTGFIMVGSNAATSVYNGGSASTNTVIYLQASVATTVNLMIF